MTERASRPVVHLELHTGDLVRAAVSHALLLGWRPERVAAGAGSYWALEVGGVIGGGVVECGTERPLWLPYVEVADVAETTERARRLGAGVLLEPREGPAGWRSVVSPPAGADIGLWQPRQPGRCAGRRRSDGPTPG